MFFNVSIQKKFIEAVFILSLIMPLDWRQQAKFIFLIHTFVVNKVNVKKGFVINFSCFHIKI